MSYEIEKKILLITQLNKIFGRCVLFKGQKLTSSSALIDTGVYFINCVGKNKLGKVSVKLTKQMRQMRGQGRQCRWR